MWGGLHVNVTLCYIVCFSIFSSIIDLLYYGIDLYYDIDFSYYDIHLSYYDIDLYYDIDFSYYDIDLSYLI